MARNFSPRKRRNKTVLSPQQRIISNYFTPRSGITKEDVNFLVKPEKEPNFKTPASRKGAVTDESEGSNGYVDQITFPLGTTGFTTAAKIHEQAARWCPSSQKQHSLSCQPSLGNASWKSLVSSQNLCNSPPQTCPFENSSSEDSAYCSIQSKQTVVHAHQKRVSSLLMASSSTSYASRKVKRTRRPQNFQSSGSLKTQKGHKQTTLILLDSEDGENSSDSDCCIVNVIRNRNPPSDSEVEEITSFTQTLSPKSSSQSSQASSQGKTSCTSNSQSSCTSESDQRSIVSSSPDSLASFKSAKQTKKQSSATSSMYGLVGDDVSESEDDSEDFSHCGIEFSQLPVEIMENIFCQLPIIDLMLNCVLVCQQWNSIISRESVIIIIIIIIILE